MNFRFLVSVCYSKAKVAAACAGIVYFLSYVPYMYIAIREEAAGDKISAFVKSLAVSSIVFHVKSVVDLFDQFVERWQHAVTTVICNLAVATITCNLAVIITTCNLAVTTITCNLAVTIIICNLAVTTITCNLTVTTITCDLTMYLSV